MPRRLCSQLPTHKTYNYWTIVIIVIIVVIIIIVGHFIILHIIIIVIIVIFALHSSLVGMQFG